MVSNPLSASAGASERHEHTTMQVLQFKVATLIDNEEEIAQFNDTISAYKEKHEIVPMVHGLKQIIKLPARLQLFDDVRRIVPLNQQMEYNLLVPYTSNKTRNVELQRRAPSYGFGFSIRGGREHGTGFFVSHVEINSDAFFQGLKVGDQIVRINGFSVEFAIHKEVLQLIQSTTNLYLRIRSVGMIPVKDDQLDDELSILLRYQRPDRISLPASLNEKYTGRKVPPNLGKTGRSVSLMTVTKRHDSLSWKMVEGQRSISPTSPPGRPLLRTYSESSILDKHYEDLRDIKLYLDLSDQTSLGVSICKGTKLRPGIFIQSTRENSLAREAGFLPGDQIIECNGSNFEDIEFQTAVKILKESKQLDLVIRRGIGFEFFGESSGYNSSSSSVNGDHQTDAGKRLSLITEDPEDGERSRSNSRRGPDEMLTVVMEHPADTVDSKGDDIDFHEEETLVKVQVHREADEENYSLNPLASSSSGSSLSSFSSAVSLEAKRRAERRDEEDTSSIASHDRRRQRDVTIKALPAERREKHAQLMQEFQQVHSKMFHHGAREYEERLGNEDYHFKVMQNGDRRQGSVEMPSLDNLTLNPASSPVKPPAVYFGGRPGKTAPGVVTISEYPNSDRRSTPSKLDFIVGNANGSHHNDPHDALTSELNSALSRSNLRQLSEPMPTPPPPPLSPQLQGTYDGQGRDYDRGHLQATEINGGNSKVFPPPEQRRGRNSVHVIQAMERAMSPPPVIARKPIAIPYTELVNNSNQVAPEALKIQVGPVDAPAVISYPSPPAPTHAPYRQQMSPTPHAMNGNSRRSSEHLMEALANKVTIKFSNGKSASAGNKVLDSLQSSEAHPQAANGILKDAAAQKQKHKTIIQQKNITFGEITTMMTCIQIQGDLAEARV